jgi:hypothetical protein
MAEKWPLENRPDIYIYTRSRVNGRAFT